MLIFRDQRLEAKLQGAFLASVAAILACTAVLKLIGGMGQRPYLVLPDPLFPFIDNRGMMIGAALLEVFVGLLLFSRAPMRGKLLVIFWLGCLFASYRTGLRLVPYSPPCGCLGFLTEWLGIPRIAADMAGDVIIAYLLSVSGLFLILPSVKCGGLRFRWIGGGSLPPVILCLLIGAGRVDAEGCVEVSCRMDSIFSLPSGWRETYALRCIICSNCWEIDIPELRGAEWRWFFDGTNVYDSLRIVRPPGELERRMAKRLGASLVPFELARTNVTIHVKPSDDGQPLGIDRVNVPWIAFCSGSYLRRPGRRIPAPVSDIRHQEDAFAYRDVVTLFDDELGLPRSIDLYCALERFDSSAGRDSFLGTHDTRVWRQEKSRFPDGALKFHYAVTAWTSLDGRTLPLAFEYVQYDFDRASNWVVSCSGTCTVSSVTATFPPLGLFNPTLAQTVLDERFKYPAKRIGGLTYTSASTALAPTNDPVLQAQFREKVRRARSLPGSWGRTAGRLLVVAVVLVAPLAISLSRSKRIRSAMKHIL
jgi:hypothetical protein